MKISETKLKGCYLIESEPFVDERGTFARTYCENEFKVRGLCNKWVQSNMSTNIKAGTLRGIHRQVGDKGEVKLVRCVRGEIWDVAVDLRKDSETYLGWIGVRLSNTEMNSLYIPEGFGHAYLTLSDEAEVHYMVSQFYSPDSESGVRWNDPKIGIEWPMHPKYISKKDSEALLL